MQTRELARQGVIRGAILAATAGLLLSSPLASADTQAPTPELSQHAIIQLNLSLPESYTAPPPEGVQNDLSVTRNIHQGSLDGVKKHKVYAFCLQRLKVDKSMRVRGWEIKDDIYFGQTRVGSKWGVGMMMNDGNFAYGVNNKGVGMTYSGENSIYRINMQEVSLEIGF